MHFTLLVQYPRWIEVLLSTMESLLYFEKSIIMHYPKYGTIELSLLILAMHSTVVLSSCAWKLLLMVQAETG